MFLRLGKGYKQWNAEGDIAKTMREKWQSDQAQAKCVIQIANAKWKTSGQKQKFKNQNFPTLK